MPTLELTDCATNTPLRWLGFAAARLTLLGQVALPPGSPMRLQLSWTTSPDSESLAPAVLHGRVVSCKRQQEGYLLQLRLVNLTRAQRLQLEAVSGEEKAPLPR